MFQAVSVLHKLLVSPCVQYIILISSHGCKSPPNFYRVAQIRRPLIELFSSAFSYFVPFRCKHIPVSQIQSFFFPCKRPSFTPLQNKKKKLKLHFRFCGFGWQIERQLWTALSKYWLHCMVSKFWRGNTRIDRHSSTEIWDWRNLLQVAYRFSVPKGWKKSYL